MSNDHAIAPPAPFTLLVSGAYDFQNPFGEKIPPRTLEHISPAGPRLGKYYLVPGDWVGIKKAPLEPGRLTENICVKSIAFIGQTLTDLGSFFGIHKGENLGR